MLAAKCPLEAGRDPSSSSNLPSLYVELQSRSQARGSRLPPLATLYQATDSLRTSGSRCGPCCHCTSYLAPTSPAKGNGHTVGQVAIPGSNWLLHRSPAEMLPDSSTLGVRPSSSQANNWVWPKANRNVCPKQNCPCGGALSGLGRVAADHGGGAQTIRKGSCSWLVSRTRDWNGVRHCPRSSGHASPIKASRYLVDGFTGGGATVGR